MQRIPVGDCRGERNSPEAIGDIQFGEENWWTTSGGEKGLKLRQREWWGLAKVQGEVGIVKAEITDEACLCGRLMRKECGRTVRIQGGL